MIIYDIWSPSVGHIMTKIMTKKGLYGFLNFFPKPKKPLSGNADTVFIQSINKISFLCFFLFKDSPVFARMPKLLNSILNVSKVFQKYAEHHGKHALLSKEELKQLLLTEFGDILRVRYTDS